ncbi:head GIN domain-containing protein [soil metagenome]
MKKLLIIFLLLAALGACRYKSGSGNIVTEKRNTGAFTGVSVGGGFEVEIKHGDQEEVTVEADDNLIKYIHTDVSDGQLKIKIEQINMHDAHLKVYITSPGLKNIKASAAADVLVKDELKSGAAIHLEVSSGAIIKTAINAPEVELDASSGGEIEVSGRTRDLNAAASSGSNLKAKELLSENVVVEASSGSNATVHASVKIDASASSGARVRYHGGAADVHKSASSGGVVEKEGA